MVVKSVIVILLGIANIGFVSHAHADFHQCVAQNCAGKGAGFKACADSCEGANPVPNVADNRLGIMTSASCRAMNGIPDESITTREIPDPPRPCRKRP